LPSGVAAPQRPYRPGFRVLCNRLQICNGNAERALERYYTSEVKTPADRESFLSRAKRAAAWLEKYAPDEFRYRLHDKPHSVPLSDLQKAGLKALRDLVAATDLDAIDPKDLNQKIYDDAIRGANVEGKDFFAAVYQRLIGRDQGPRLPGFIKEIGRDKLLELL
jgi:lysyl-tRNA synthetase class 1